MTGSNQDEFERRRTQLMRLIGEDGIAILPAAPVRQRNNDVDYNYRQDSDFYYLTGFSEPEAVAVLVPGRAIAEYILFHPRARPGTRDLGRQACGTCGRSRRVRRRRCFSDSRYRRNPPRAAGKPLTRLLYDGAEPG